MSQKVTRTKIERCLEAIECQAHLGIGLDLWNVSDDEQESIVLEMISEHLDCIEKHVRIARNLIEAKDCGLSPI